MAQETCPICDGKGGTIDWEEEGGNYGNLDEICDHCDGLGYIEVESTTTERTRLPDYLFEPCPYCFGGRCRHCGKGTGIYTSDCNSCDGSGECPVCEGTGRVLKDLTLSEVKALREENRDYLNNEED